MQRTEPTTFERLSEDGVRKVQEHIARTWLKYECPVCGNNELSIGKYVVALPVFSSGATVIGGPVMPVITVGCDRCGNVRLLSTKLAGLELGAAHG